MEAPSAGAPSADAPSVDLSGGALPGGEGSSGAGAIPPTSLLLRLALVALLLALDLWSKSAVFAWLGARPEGLEHDAHGHLRYPLAGEWLSFMLSYNPGMAWGFDALPPLLLVGGRALAALLLVWLLARTPAERRALVAALVLILAGALGNLYDNLFLDPRRLGATFGEVRDFIDVYFAAFDWHFPTFNVADSCITVGALFLLVSSFAPAAKPARAGLGEPSEGAAA